MNNPAIIGAIPVFSYNEGLAVSAVTISAEIGASNLANTVGTYAEINPEFEGIKRLNFFRYFEEINTLLPVETTFDVSKNMMYTKTDELGTYCIMDMEIWLDSLGGAELLEAAQADTEPETEPEQQSMRAFSAANLTLQSKVDVQPLGATMAVSPVLPGANEAVAESLGNEEGYNVIFITEDRTEFKEYIELASKYITNDGGTVQTEIISEYQIYDSSSTQRFDVSKEMLKVLNSDSYNKDRKTYIFLIFRENNIRANANSSQELLTKLYGLSDKKPSISIVTGLTEYTEESFLAKRVAETHGVAIDTDLLKSDKVTVVRAMLNHLKIHISQVKYISSVNLVPLPYGFDSIYIQDVYDNGIDGKTDYDVDGLNDYSEIAFDSGLVDFSLSEPFPTLARCKKYVSDPQNLVYVEEGLSRFMDTHTPGPDLVYHLSQIPILPINSDPTSEDGDDDGLLDGKEITDNSIKVAPKDNEPLRKTPHSELWKHHISEMKNGSTPQTTISTYNPYLPAELGSIAGDMESDYYFIVHANVIAWQKRFGYNNVYDTGLSIGDWGRMRRLKLPFNYAGKEYIIWAWRGDYLNLGAGAELGIYVNTGRHVESIPILKEFTLLTYLLWRSEYPTYQYSVVDFYLPMTLHLYQEKTSSEYNTVYNWAPIEEQWWITGFEPQMQMHDPSDLIMINSIDFSEKTEIYKAVKDEVLSNVLLSQYVIFDDSELTLWIIWGDETK
jgi:hypothetical protein